MVVKTVSWRKLHNLKVVSWVFFRDLTDYNLGDNLSDTSEEVLQTGKGGARIYRSFCWEKKLAEHQKITANHKEQASQVNDFSAFLKH